MPKLPSPLWQASPRQAGAAGCAWRIEYEGALYHVLSRGNEAQDFVINDENRKVFLATASEMDERFDIDVFA